jgi:hypothetical protein
MRFATRFLPAILVATFQVPCPAAEPESSMPPAKAAAAPPVPTTLELIEDLRILSIVNPLQPRREQIRRLAALATGAAETLSAMEADAEKVLEQQRDRLLAARKQGLRGAPTAPETDGRVGAAGEAAESARARKLEQLIVRLTAQVRAILTPEQAATIENDLAPTGDQPWRRYARVLSGPPAPPRGALRMPADPGKWLNELRDLRIDSAEGDPAFEVQDFAKKLTTGLRPGTPLFEQAFAQARAFASDVLAMPPLDFSNREWELARLAAKQELATRNQQRAADGRTAESFDPYRWLVEAVMLSPRAAPTLRERAGAGGGSTPPDE